LSRFSTIRYIKPEHLLSIFVEFQADKPQSTCAGSIINFQLSNNKTNYFIIPAFVAIIVGLKYACTSEISCYGENYPWFIVSFRQACLTFPAGLFYYEANY
jgi:hypothetical protein